MAIVPSYFLNVTKQFYDAIEEGYLKRNPYKWINIERPDDIPYRIALLS